MNMHNHLEYQMLLRKKDRDNRAGVPLEGRCATVSKEFYDLIVDQTGRNILMNYSLTHLSIGEPMRETILTEAMEKIAKGYKRNDKGHTVPMRKDEMLNIARRALIKIRLIDAESLLPPDDDRKGS